MATIVTEYKGDMLFESVIGKHRITIDVPADMGGQDRGVTPPQVFIASLGGCIGAFVAHYCREAGINEEGLTVELSFDKVSDPTRLVNLKAKVHLPNGELGKREEAAKRVALHCPVHESIKDFGGLELEIVDNSKA
ncbi:MAG: OsmC family protein [Anaerolineae bacterium]|jgi:putative redox protein|nr:OsmC family protein [Anaerolineae bacterium]